MLQKTSGKLIASDERMSRLLSWAPWLSFLIVNLPMPIVFLVLFLAAGTTETAAIYLLLSFVSVGLGLVVGLLILITLLFYRRRWHSRLRDRLAADGITAAEVSWFASELSSEERKTWADLKQKNPLLADAYCETLAARLTATRIIARARGETLKVERQINRTRNLRDVDTSKLLSDLLTDRKRSEELRQEATVRLSETKARLQTIESAANRKLSETETDLMLRRLTASQEFFPLALQMAGLEEEALREMEPRPLLENPETLPKMDDARNLPETSSEG
jgi:nitrogen fixation/metabolism regulation signal transduction histidine kinase